MTTSTSSSTTPTLRLRLSPTPGKGPLDGGWWPRSKDLEVELADLVDHFPSEAGRVARALFSRPDWVTQPRRIKVARGFLKAGSFPSDDTHLMLLRLSAGEELRLLVVPPEAARDVGRDLLTHAASPSNRRSGSELLARAREGAFVDGSDRWSDDGAPVFARRSPR